MIAIIFIWCYIFLVTLACGFLILKLLQRLLFKGNTNKYTPLFIINLIGLACLGSVLSALSLVYKIGFAANVIIIAISFVGLVACRKELAAYLTHYRNQLKGIHPTFYALAALGVIAVLSETAAEVKIYDTGLYHAQAIQWINKYGIVPGLGNLHQRFAFNNQSFVLEAFFNFRFLCSEPFHALNGFIITLFVLTIVYMFAKETTQAKRFAYCFLLLIPFFFYTKFISSTSPDVQVSTITCFIFIIYLRNKDHALDINFWAILILSAYLITVKQSSMPIALLSIFYVIKNLRSIQWKAFLIAACICMVFFIPYFARNYYISGYLVYPLPGLDLFNPDWKIPKEFVEQMNTILKGWARTHEWSVEKPFSVWFPSYFSKLTIFNKASFLASLLMPVLFMAVRSMTKFKAVFPSKFTVLYVLTLIYTFFWLFSVPELRYIFYIHTLILTLAFIDIYSYLESKRLTISKNQVITKVLGVMVAVLFFFSLGQTIRKSSIAEHIVWPASYPVAKIKQTHVNSAVVNSPEDNELCWDTCIPCSIDQGKIGISPLLEFRGDDLSKGFRASSKTKKPE